MSDDKKVILGYFWLFCYMIAILGSVRLQKQQGRKRLRKLFTVCDCKSCLFISVTAKKKKKTEPVCDCNYLAFVNATRNYVWLQKEI
jgi:hypothetical protein